MIDPDYVYLSVIFVFCWVTPYCRVMNRGDTDTGVGHPGVQVWRRQFCPQRDLPVFGKLGGIAE